MDAREAIIRIEDHNRVYAAKEFPFAIKITEALNMAVEALKKQDPKKPIRANRIIVENDAAYLDDNNEYWKCPICTNVDVPLLENQPYCHNCGQAMDWE